MGVKRHPRSYATEQAVCRALAVLAFAAAGVGEVMRAYSPRADFLRSMAMVIPLVFACVYDARERGDPIPPSAQWLVLFFAPFIVPGYWVSNYGWRGLWTVVRTTIGLGLVMIVSAYVTIVVRPYLP
jgi:hypothetical protein